MCQARGGALGRAFGGAFAQVVLAANEEPSINDITASELTPLLEQAAQLDPDVLG